MRFFESLVLLLLAAILLLQVSRRMGLPYPAMLALAGVGLALVPGVPAITLDPHTALALFIAPVLVDAAFDFPVVAVWRLWRPLFALAVVAVVLTAGTVAALGVAVAGLPFYAALALGAVVAPPDAAAATAVLSSVRMPRRAVAVLKGESLLNDAMALLLFNAAVLLSTRGGVDGAVALELGIAAPGGILLGIVLARFYRRFLRFVQGTLGGNLLEFVGAFSVWLLAERLHLSAVLCVVAFAMTLARGANMSTPPRMRVHSFAVWTSVTFLLNVLAFLLMGMQARAIVGGMDADRLVEAARFAALVVAAVIVVRIGWVLAYNRLALRFAALRGEFEPASARQGLLVGWAGMRGLVTLATAFALPGDFPQRDLIVLTAFAVVLATLVVQGLTLAPLVRLLRLDGGEDADELDRARAELAGVGLETLAGEGAGEGAAEAQLVRDGLILQRAAADGSDPERLKRKRMFGTRALAAQRERLQVLREEDRIGAEAYLVLQEELDFHELAMASEADREIEEN
jgi:monovalent cation/hydrogen antiporter